MQATISTTPDARADANRANAQHSTGPRTPEGKARSAQNAVTHGLTTRTAVLPSEDPAAFELHREKLQDEYHPKTATEIQLVQELADTSWRLNRIPFLEADLLTRAMNPPNEQAAIDFDIVDAHRLLATLGLHGHRLSRQYQKTLQLLWDIQAERKQTERRELTRAAGIMELHKHKGLPYNELHKHKGLPYNPADDGFVFSKHEIETHAQRLVRSNDARHIEHVRFFGQPLATPYANHRSY